MSLPLPREISPSQFPAHGWTPERKARFLQALSIHGNARAACRTVGMSAEAAYKLRRRDPLFARGWAAAVLLGRDNSIATLGERAIEGVEEDIYYRGELVGTRRRYDSRLLLAHLARLDRLADEQAAGADSGRFDELVACIADGSPALPPARKDYVDDLAIAADNEVRRQQMEDEPELFDESLGNLTNEEGEYLETLDAACIEAAERAAEKAGQDRDERRIAAFAAIDSLCERQCDGQSDEPKAPADASPAALPPALAALVVEPPAEPASVGSDGKGLSFRCTLSTVSTATLATALAGPVPFQQPAPRSFARRRQSRHTDAFPMRTQ